MVGVGELQLLGHRHHRREREGREPGPPERQPRQRLDLIERLALGHVPQGPDHPSQRRAHARALVRVVSCPGHGIAGEPNEPTLFAREERSARRRGAPQKLVKLHRLPGEGRRPVHDGTERGLVLFAQLSVGIGGLEEHGDIRGAQLAVLLDCLEDVLDTVTGGDGLGRRPGRDPSGDEELSLSPDKPEPDLHDRNWYSGYLFSQALTIGGGTGEVQRNIVAERVLEGAIDPSWLDARGLAW